MRLDLERSPRDEWGWQRLFAKLGLGKGGFKSAFGRRGIGIGLLDVRAGADAGDAAVGLLLILSVGCGIAELVLVFPPDRYQRLTTIKMTKKDGDSKKKPPVIAGEACRKGERLRAFSSRGALGQHCDVGRIF